MVGTFAAMWLLGFSLDNLSLMALTLSVGFVVDDAIVMLENIVRHMEQGKPPLRAALDGSREIGFTIVSMTLSLVAVFIPVLFMGGIIGRLLHEFAVTIGVAILVSGVVSLSLTPMLCSRFLRPGHGGGRAAALDARLASASSRRGLRGYERTLAARCGIPRVVLAIFAASLAATVAAYRVMPKGFLPSEDTGFVFGFTEAAEGISFAEMAAAPEGRRPGDPRRSGDVALDLRVDRRQRAERVGEHGPDLRRPEAALRARRQRRRGDRAAAARARRRSPASACSCRTRRRSASAASSPRASTSSRSRASTPTALYAGAEALLARLRKLPELRDVTSDLQLQNPTLHVEILRDRAAALGVTAEPDRGRALQRLRVAAGLDDLRARRPVRRDHGARARSGARTRSRSACCACARRRASWCRSSPWRGSSARSDRSR